MEQLVAQAAFGGQPRWAVGNQAERESGKAVSNLERLSPPRSPGCCIFRCLEQTRHLQAPGLAQTASSR